MILSGLLALKYRRSVLENSSVVQTRQGNKRNKNLQSAALSPSALAWRASVTCRGSGGDKTTQSYFLPPWVLMLGWGSRFGLQTLPAIPACFPATFVLVEVESLLTETIVFLPFTHPPFHSEHIFPMRAFSPLKSFSLPQRVDSLSKDRKLNVLSKGQIVIQGDTVGTQ